MIQPFDDNYFMKKALQEAKRAFDKGEVPVGAVIVLKNQIIARAHNLTETLNDVTAHAEMLAITAASDYLGTKYLNDCTLYVTLEPCAMCAMALVHARVDRVVFATADPRTGAAGSVLNILNQNEFNHHCQVEKGLMQSEASQQLKLFFRNKRKS